MAQSRHIGFEVPCTKLPFGICAIYFDLKVPGTQMASILEESAPQNKVFSKQKKGGHYLGFSCKSTWSLGTCIAWNPHFPCDHA